MKKAGIEPSSSGAEIWYFPLEFYNSTTQTHCKKNSVVNLTNKKIYAYIAAGSRVQHPMKKNRNIYFFSPQK